MGRFVRVTLPFWEAAVEAVMRLLWFYETGLAAVRGYCETDWGFCGPKWWVSHESVKMLIWMMFIRQLGDCGSCNIVVVPLMEKRWHKQGFGSICWSFCPPVFGSGSVFPMRFRIRILPIKVNVDPVCNTAIPFCVGHVGLNGSRSTQSNPDPKHWLLGFWCDLWLVWETVVLGHEVISGGCQPGGAGAGGRGGAAGGGLHHSRHPRLPSQVQDLTNIVREKGNKYRDGILEHQFNKSLESFAPCYSQSLLLADFKENPTLLWFLKSLQKNPQNEKTRVYSWIPFCTREK